MVSSPQWQATACHCRPCGECRGDAGPGVHAGGERRGVHRGRAHRPGDVHAAGGHAIQGCRRLQSCLHGAISRAGMPSACHACMCGRHGMCLDTSGHSTQSSCLETPCAKVIVRLFLLSGQATDDLDEAEQGKGMSRTSKTWKHVTPACGNVGVRVHGDDMPDPDRIAARVQDASCVSSASLGALEFGTLLPADTFDVQASFEVPAHTCPTSLWLLRCSVCYFLARVREVMARSPLAALQCELRWQPHAWQPDQQRSSA